jgi:ATP-dependent RNA helicase RhlE
VVNYDLPNVPEDYVHRIGRTGRAGATGEAVSLVCVDEHQMLKDIEKLIKQTLPRDVIPGFEPDLNAKAQPIQLRSGDRGHTGRGRPNGGGGARNAGGGQRQPAQQPRAAGQRPQGGSGGNGGAPRSANGGGNGAPRSANGGGNGGGSRGGNGGSRSGRGPRTPASQRTGGGDR